MRFVKVCVVLLAVFLSACSTESSSDELFKEVMVFHDEVMPYMGTLYKAEKKMKADIAAMDSTVQEKREIMQAQLDTLVNAQDRMNQWMRGMKAAYSKELTEQEKINVLKEQLEEVKVINEELKAAKKIADSL